MTNVGEVKKRMVKVPGLGRLAYLQMVRYRQKIRAMEKLGGAFCVECGCTDIRILEFNHKNGGGGRWRRLEMGRTGHRNVLVQEYVLTGKLTSKEVDVRCRVCNALDYVTRLVPSLRLKFNVRWNGTRVPFTSSQFYIRGPRPITKMEV
jgi:hypothetical protein